MTTYWNDFLFVHSSRLDGAKHSAHTATKIQKEIVHTCVSQQSIKDVKTVWYWYLTAKVKNGSMKVKTTPKPSESKIDCTESLEKEGQKSIPANKYGKERINHSQDPVN